MRKINRAKRLKVGVWGGVAVLGTAIIFGESVGGKVATANANGDATLTGAAGRGGANGGFWPRLGSDAIPISEFDGNFGYAGVLTDGVGNEKTPMSATAARGSVELAGFAGYSVRSGFDEQEDSVSGRTRLVDWTAPDARSETLGTAVSNANPAASETVVAVEGNEKDSETARFSGNSEDGENGENASRSKTPILRDEPVATAQSDGSLAGALVSTFGALAVVLGAFFALVAFLKRTGANGGGVGNALEIVDSTSVGDKARLLTIRWGNRLILAAKTPEKIAPLAEITDVDEANALLDEIKRRKENASLGKVGEKTTAIWKRGRDAASVWRKALAAKGRR